MIRTAAMAKIPAVSVRRTLQPMNTGKKSAPFQDFEPTFCSPAVGPLELMAHLHPQNVRQVVIIFSPRGSKLPEVETAS